jgi:hypothetical protein
METVALLSFSIIDGLSSKKKMKDSLAKALAQ